MYPFPTILACFLPFWYYKYYGVVLFEEGHVVPKMGTIISRKRADGTVGYTAQILIKRKGKIVHREAKTFDRKQIAKAWLARRETELSEPGAMSGVPILLLRW